jgi:hypothetical protein
VPGCVLHVMAGAFDPVSVLATMSLCPYVVFRKGDPRFPDNPKSQQRHQTGGFKCDVSTADGVLRDEVQDAIAFLKRHHRDLARLKSIPEIESMTLDIGHYLRIDGEACMVQCDSLPPELLRLAGDLGIGIELSLYPRT